MAMRVVFGGHYASPDACLCSEILKMWYVPHLKLPGFARIFKKHFLGEEK